MFIVPSLITAVIVCISNTTLLHIIVSSFFTISGSYATLLRPPFRMICLSYALPTLFTISIPYSFFSLFTISISYSFSSLLTIGIPYSFFAF